MARSARKRDGSSRQRRSVNRAGKPETTVGERIFPKSGRFPEAGDIRAETLSLRRSAEAVHPT